jgi:aspartate/methionine/tyrosine aminotransferase
VREPQTNLATLGTTIFETMSRLAEAHGAVNLGQGFPDEGGPANVIEEARRYLLEGNNQYPPMVGLLALRHAIARHEAEHYGLVRDPATEVLVTSGATEALGAAILALVEPGDRVVVFEPLYDSYVPMIRRAGGIVVPLRLEPPDFALRDELVTKLRASGARLILLNDPQNPSGKAFTQEELAAIAAAARELDAYVLSDEVYEHLVFDERPHVPIATLPDAAERTLKVGSAGKVFSMTGWKVGWITGPGGLVRAVSRAHQYLTFTTPPNLQAAVAHGLVHEVPWVHALRVSLQRKRDHLAQGLANLGMRVLPCAGSYFLVVALSGTEWAGRDEDYARHLVEHRKVASIPLAPFYVDSPRRDLVRLCFAKRYEVLDAALERLGTTQ